MKKIISIDARLYNNWSWAWKIATETINLLIEKYSSNYKKIIIFTNSKKNFWILKKFKKDNVNIIYIWLNFILYKFFILPFYLFFYKVDLLFSPTTDIPFFKIWKCKYISMIHDLFVEENINKDIWENRGLFYWIKYLLKTKDLFIAFYIMWLFKKCALNSDLIVSISNFTKSQIIKLYNVNETKIKTIYIWVENIFLDNKTKNTNILEKYWIKNKYIFTFDAVTLYEPFWDIINDFCKKNNLDWVILNKHNVIYESFLKTKASKSNSIFIKEFIEKEELINLIKNCEFIFFPSPWEWFWIPIVESFALWKNIIAQNITAIPEIWWKYIYLYNNFDELNEKLEEIYKSNFSNHELNSYCKENFTWEKYIEELNKVFISN